MTPATRDAGTPLPGRLGASSASRGAEAFGNAAAEAMMRGTAVVASVNGGFKEYVHHEQTGLLVPPGDPAALAKHTASSDRPGIYGESLGQAGRRFVLNPFDQKPLP